MKKKYRYVITMQYLGFRYHGWQKQPDVKTVQGMLDRTINFVIDSDNFKTLGTGRTDAMVSANHYACQIFLTEPIKMQHFKKMMNQNLPADVRINDIKEVDSSFRIINDSKMKEYIYFFAFGEKFHPFCAPFMANFNENLDIELMKQGAKLFEGDHWFKNYCYQPNPDALFQRTVIQSEIKANEIYTANFFPKSSFAYHVRGAGFGRHQIRLMMGMLLNLGQGKVNLSDIKQTLISGIDAQATFAAPASGLILHKLEFQNN